MTCYYTPYGRCISEKLIDNLTNADALVKGSTLRTRDVKCVICFKREDENKRYTLMQGGEVFV